MSDIKERGLWIWTSSRPDDSAWLGEHRVSGYVVEVQKAQPDPGEPEEWGYALPMQRGPLDAVAYSDDDSLHQTAEEAMADVERLFDEQGKLKEPERLWEEAFRDKQRFASVADRMAAMNRAGMTAKQVEDYEKRMQRFLK
jgi:hypothetical protein